MLEDRKASKLNLVKTSPMALNYLQTAIDNELDDDHDVDELQHDWTTGVQAALEKERCLVLSWYTWMAANKIL